MGKTTLAVSIIKKHILPHVNRCFAVCPTWYQQKTLKPLRDVPNAFVRKNVFTHVDDGVFEQIFNELNRRPCPTLLFVDDAAAEGAVNKGNKGSFSRLCLASPHLQLTIVGCFQRLTSASPALRDNAEGLISFIPSKALDVGTLVDEFNPHPAHLKSKDLVKMALERSWAEARFAFIWREAFTGKMGYYAGFKSEVQFNK